MPAPRYRVGDLEVTLLRTGRFRLDGGAMFGVVPRVLWERVSPPDEQHRIRLACNCLLVRGPGLPEAGVVIDTGIGDKWDAKGRALYAIEDGADLPVPAGLEGTPGIALALAAEGVRAEDVREVLLTHLHFDHTGGSTRFAQGAPGSEHRTIVPTFPRARCRTQKGNLEEEARSPIELRKASYLPENFEPLAAADLLSLLEGDGEVYPGISVQVTGGHQRWHQIVLLRSRGETAAFLGDLVPTAAHIPPPWIMGYDHFPLETLAQKKALLPRAADERWLLLLEHEPTAPAGRVHRDGARWRYEPEAPHAGGPA